MCKGLVTVQCKYYRDFVIDMDRSVVVHVVWEGNVPCETEGKMTAL